MKKWFGLMLVMSTILYGCQSSDENSEENTEGKLSVVTSFYPMYEFARQVAGERAEVSLMVSAGEDAHHYEPSAKDVAKVNEADVFVYSSEEMEHWAESLLETTENEKLVVARTADGVESAHSHEHSGGEEQEPVNIEIQGAAEHYHTGDMIELSAETDNGAEFEHWHWYTRKSADDEWAAIPNEFSSELEYLASIDNFEVRAVLFDDNHREFAESEPVKIVIDNHGETPGHGEEEGHEHGEEEQEHSHEHGDEEGHEHGDEEGHDHSHGEGEETNHDHEHGSAEGAESVEIIGLADHYHTGDVVTLVAELQGEADYQHWHWYSRSGEDEEWEAISGQETDHFEYKNTGESFDVKAVLLDDDHNTYAESEPISVLIDDHENKDPHIWLDPVLVQEQVKIIRDALIKADPDGKEVYEKNTEAFNNELQELHEDYEAALEDAEKRVFVVQHQAFGYLADRYDLEQIAIGGLSTEVEPSPSRIAEIGDLVKEHKVPIIYYQQGANSSIAETVAAETGTETATLFDLEVLSKELEEKDLGYLEAMRENLESLQLSVQ